MINYIELLKKWFNRKTSLNNKFIDIFFKERQVWMMSVGLNIGNEQNGGGRDFRRPCLILKKLSPSTLLIIPMTSQKKENLYRITIEIKKQESYLQLDQVKTVSSKRLLYKMQTINREDFESIKNKFLEIF